MSAKKFCNQIKYVKLMISKTFNSMDEARAYINKKVKSFKCMSIIDHSMIIYDGMDKLLINIIKKNNKVIVELVGGLA